MKNLASLKKELIFNRNLAELIEVLKNIAVSQFRALEQMISSFNEFFLAINDFFSFISKFSLSHPFLQPSGDKQIILAITSDSGLLGGLNMEVINRALIELKKSSGELVVIGERGKIYAKEKNIPFVFFKGIEEEKRFNQAIQLRDYLIKKFLRDSFGYLKVVYPHPVSFTVQKIETVELIPFSFNSHQEGKNLDVILESKPADIIEYLVYLWLGRKLYDIFGLSKLAEFAARFVHLETSLQKIKEMDRKIQLHYFRIRHEIIDRNMRELFSARSLYGG